MYRTPSSQKGFRPRSPGPPVDSVMLMAALLLGIFSLGLVGFSMHPVLLEEAVGASARRGRGRSALPGETSVEPMAMRPGCVDSSEECPAWASIGECRANAGFMYESCMASCGGCVAAYLHAVSPTVELTKDVKMPVVGFGTAGLGDHTAEAVKEALLAGYRKIDSAQSREWYREDLVGEALKSSSIPRSELFLTTKVHPKDLGARSTEEAVKKSLEDLGTDYLDLVMLHYPECFADVCKGKTPEGTWKDSWVQLEKMVEAGTIRCLGVSNFYVSELAELIDTAKIKPCLVQSNYEPLKPAFALQGFCRRHSIQFESYSTLGGLYGSEKGANPLLHHPTILKIAKTKGRSAAQVVLRWALQLEQTVVPRSASPAHMRENLRVFDFDLTDGEMVVMEAMGVMNLQDQ